MGKWSAEQIHREMYITDLSSLFYASLGPSAHLYRKPDIRLALTVTITGEDYRNFCSDGK